MPKFPEIPGYRFVKELGRGGMADVYLAVQENLNRMVAVKILIPSVFRDSLFQKRFRREAQTLSKLVHPNIITIYDVGRKGDTYYIVMEYLQESLKERIKTLKRRSPDESLLIIRQVAGALFYAHREGFIHRDIKPDNIMFRKDGTPVLLDFGIARPIKAATKLTKTGMSVGTPNYISPEQAKGETIDGRSDFYSLGVVLFEMLTGRVPYDAENTLGVVLKHIDAPVPRLPSALRAYQHLIDRLMAKEARRRLRSEEELNRLIGDLLVGKSVPPAPRSKAKPKKNSAGPAKTKEMSGPGAAGVAKPKPSAPPKRRRSRATRGFLAAVVIVAAVILFFRYGPGTGGPEALDSEDVKAMIQRNDFFDSIWNRYGKHRGRYTPRSIGGERVVLDTGAGLMWHPGGSTHKMRFGAAEQWLVNLNRRRYAGYSDWRLPTLKEAATLLRSPGRPGNLCIDALFSQDQPYIWTSDRYGANGAWVIRFDDGYMLGCPRDLEHYVRPVRRAD